MTEALSGSVIFEGDHSLFVGGPAMLLPSDKEVAWAGGQHKLRTRPDMAYLAGRFVEADHVNENGHIYDLADLARAHETIASTPLNLLHRAHHVIGSFLASELVLPASGLALAASDVETAEGRYAHVEVLAGMWRWTFPDEYAAIERAFQAGGLWFSKEAVPQSLTCMAEGGCNQTFEYAGTSSPTYCEHLNEFKARRRLNNPLFVGGAVILPPTKPGWKKADVSELSALIEANLAQAEDLYDAVAAASPELDAAQWESIMQQLLLRSAGGPVTARKVSSSKRHDLAKEGKALPDGSFPIETVADLRNAIQAYGRAKNKAAVRRHIIKRAKALNRTDLLPEWASAMLAELELGEVAALTAAEAGQAGQGVIVAMVPPEAMAAALAELGTEAAEDIHVTLAFLGQAEGDTLTGHGGVQVTKDRVTGALASFAAGAAPLGRAVLSGLGVFRLPDGKEATYASVDAPGLDALRARLVAALEAAGVPVSDDHGFTPHATLAYHPAGEGPKEMPDELSWAVESIELWWAGDHHRFELANGKVPIGA